MNQNIIYGIKSKTNSICSPPAARHKRREARWGSLRSQPSVPARRAVKSATPRLTQSRGEKVVLSNSDCSAVFHFSKFKSILRSISRAGRYSVGDPKPNAICDVQLPPGGLHTNWSKHRLLLGILGLADWNFPVTRCAFEETLCRHFFFYWELLGIVENSLFKPTGKKSHCKK